MPWTHSQNHIASYYRSLLRTKYAIAHVLLGAHHLWRRSCPDLLWANHQLIASPMRLSHTPSSWRE